MSRSCTESNFKICQFRATNFGASFFSLAFAPSGKFLAAGSGYDVPEDKAMMFWDLDPTVWMQAACAIAGRNLRPEEWLRYAGEETAEETCPSGPGLR